MFQTAYLLVLVTAELFLQIYKTTAYTIPCAASLETARKVRKCPFNETSYERAVKAKNCSSIAKEGRECVSKFEYHCVLSENFEYAVEVCAPSILIIGSVCTMFSTQLKGISRIEGKECKKCPYGYNSTSAFQYAECYSNLSKYSRTETQQSTESMPTSPDGVNDVAIRRINGEEIALYAIITLLTILVAILVSFICWKKRQGRSKKPQESIPMLVKVDDSSDNIKKENHMYEDNGAKLLFSKLSNYLAENFPQDKLNMMKHLIIDSGCVTNKSSIENAASIRDCLKVLKDENVFTPTDVIFVQFLCRESHCWPQYNKCLEYAKGRKVLCFYEKQTGSDLKNVEFHVQGILSEYSKEKIQQIKETVASILDCDVEKIIESGIRHSKSFLLVLSMKEIHVAILTEMNERDRLRLMESNIDYFVDDLGNVHYMCSRGLQASTSEKVERYLSEYEKCIQRSFSLLEDELPVFTHLMGNVLNQSNCFDIENCTGRRRQISKLLKIVLMKGRSACMELFRVLEENLKRTDLIEKMKKRSTDIEMRGKPLLCHGLRSLNITCLQKYKEMLHDELEPLSICDLLLEERAIEIPAHDKITETSRRAKQIEYLLENLEENKNNCFHFFLFILQREEFQFIRSVFEKEDAVVGGTDQMTTKSMGQRLTDGFQTEMNVEHGLPINENCSDNRVIKFESREKSAYKKTDTTCPIDTSKTMDSVDPNAIHIKAENIKKKIISNFQKILEEMQNLHVKETLSYCPEDVDSIMKARLQIDGRRKQRMQTCLEVILDVDISLIYFEKTLMHYGLGRML